MPVDLRPTGLKRAADDSLNPWPLKRRRVNDEAQHAGKPDVVSPLGYETAPRLMLSPELCGAEPSRATGQDGSPEFRQLIGNLKQSGPAATFAALTPLLAQLTSRSSINELLHIANVVSPLGESEPGRELLLSVARHAHAPRRALRTLMADPTLSDAELALVASNRNADAELLHGVAVHPNLKCAAAIAVLRNANAGREAVHGLMRRLLRAGFPLDTDLDELGGAIACNTAACDTEIIAFALHDRATPFLVGLARNPKWSGLTKLVLDRPLLATQQLHRIITCSPGLPLQLTSQALGLLAVTSSILKRLVVHNFHPVFFDQMLEHRVMTDAIRLELFAQAAKHAQTSPAFLQRIASDPRCTYTLLGTMAAHESVCIDPISFYAILRASKTDAAVVNRLYVNAAASRRTSPRILEFMILSHRGDDATRMKAVLHPNVSLEMLRRISADPTCPATITLAARIRLQKMQTPSREASPDSDETVSD